MCNFMTNNLALIQLFRLCVIFKYINYTYIYIIHVYIIMPTKYEI